MSRSTTTAALVAAALAFSTEAGAFELKHSGEGELVSWRRSRIAWTIDRSVRDIPGGEAAVVAAIDAWTQRGGAPSLAVEATGAELEPGLDGKNVVFYAPNGYAPAGRALAVTVLSFDDRTGEVIEADIVINGKYRFAPIAGGTPAHASEAAPKATYDIGRVLAHEMGHALGLSDELELSDALMYPYVPRERALVASPGNDDVLGLNALYGGASVPTAASRTEGADAKANAGCSSSPVAPPRRSAVAAGLAFIALAVAVVRRRRSSSSATFQAR